ncbi:hypothetical protein OSB04_021889 [Centaurea solstitialis]|uniref:Uncharacterized protein n=1 Tax=Centaurea solstitialis TaxID=347529 RepID=A0AA38T8G4_9ASTR|nr:hypothetical protein OSB04_021889 [Centaurea solstitialis]
MGYCIPGTLTSPLPPSNPTPTKSLISASIQRNQIPLIGKKVGRRLIRISTAEGKWQGNWTADYNFSLRDLRLDDLVEDGDPNDARAFVSLSIHRITTNFNVWVLPSSKDGDSNQLPEIGGDDPSVIYVKPGCEADLDSLIQDTIRLTTSVNETCSDFCEKSELGLRHLSKPKAPTVDKRWSKLLELKKSYQ